MSARCWSLRCLLGATYCLLGATYCLFGASGCLPGTPVPDNLPPTARAGADRTVSVGRAVDFDSRQSIDPDGDIVGHSWSFGDGASSEQAVISHSYATAGGYVVTLTVTDNSGDSASDEAVITVSGGEPLAVVDVTPTSVHLFETVTFDASASTALAAIVSYEWTFGDGASASGAIVSHGYQTTGSFRAALAVTDAQQRIGRWEQVIAVLGIAVDGVFDVAPTPASFSCASYSAQFTDTVLTMTTSGSALTATSAAGHSYSGTLAGVEFDLSATFTASTGGSCGSAPVDATLSGSFSDADHFSGTATAYYDLDVGCQCSTSYAVVGVKR